MPIDPIDLDFRGFQSLFRDAVIKTMKAEQSPQDREAASAAQAARERLGLEIGRMASQV